VDGHLEVLANLNGLEHRFLNRDRHHSTRRRPHMQSMVQAATSGRDALALDRYFDPLRNRVAISVVDELCRNACGQGQSNERKTTCNKRRHETAPSSCTQEN